VCTPTTTAAARTDTSEKLHLSTRMGGSKKARGKASKAKKWGEGAPPEPAPQPH
jgi:hypothetical protein